MEKEVTILPSLLSADFLHLSSDINSLIKAGTTSIHYDVMDGMFVPDISFGEKLFRSLYQRYHKRLHFDVHLMTEDPFRHIRQFLALGEASFTFHYENTINRLSQLDELRDEHPSISFGLAFSPQTDVSLILGVADRFDQILVMSVTPGSGGQAFIPGSLEKIRRLALFREVNNLSFKIGVDGGIDDETAPCCIEAGADYLVSGSYIFGSSDRAAAIDSLKRVRG